MSGVGKIVWKMKELGAIEGGKEVLEREGPPLDPPMLSLTSTSEENKELSIPSLIPSPPPLVILLSYVNTMYCYEIGVPDEKLL